jgi:hypothetical protein
LTRLETTGYYYHKVLSVLPSYSSEYLEVIQNEILSRRLFGGKDINHRGPNQVRIVDFPMLVRVLWPEITLMKVLCEKEHCGDIKSTCPFKDFVFLTNALLQMFHTKKDECLVDCFAGTNS